MSNEQAELSISAAISAGEIDRATEEAIRLYGAELIGWLVSILPADCDTQEAFSRLSEDLWRSFRRFDGRCSVRTWCYMLARHVASRIRTQPRRQHEDLVSSIPSVAQAVTHVWNTTRAHNQRVQDVYAEIRGELDEEDQTLLVLRVDRDLAWRDIAIVLLGEEADPEDITRKAASLRKQFERVKTRLRELAAERLRE